MHPFAAQLATAARIVEARLGDIISREAVRGAPPRLVEATRHAVLGGGKRFRPFLVFESASLFGVSAEDALEAAAAIECIHCYSLVHDDLPTMDNDELRRGRPTVWKKTAACCSRNCKAAAQPVASRSRSCA
ncbi:MAG: polyprenyl synthetase family protein, partial [Hyphomicrobium sp.]